VNSLSSLLLYVTICAAPATSDPLPSWNDTPHEKAIVAFVEKVTNEDSPDFVPAEERIAVFDNDGTLWVEQPMYTQLAFIIDRGKALAPEHPGWSKKEPYASLLAGNLAAAGAAGGKELMELSAVTQSGMSCAEFETIVMKWLNTAQNPKFKRPYLECVYQPQLELLEYLRDNGFKTFIVSGGGIDFMRPWTLPVYGIPPYQVVGSAMKLEYEAGEGKPVVMRLPEIDFIDDKAGKPVGIQRHIGLRPILAFGNSDGDFEMLQYTTTGSGPRMGLILHHDDAKREAAYDRDSHFGRLDRALDEASMYGWVVVSMKDDWSEVFPPEK